MAGVHSSLSASGAPAYCRCPGKPNAERGLTDETSIFAAEGTAAHEVAADCLEMGFEPEDFLGSVIRADGYDIEVSPGMVKALTPGIRKVRFLSEGGLLFVEQRVSLEPIIGPDQFGTTDVGIIRLIDNEIIVWDWKYGAGVPVHPAEDVLDADGDVVGYRLNEQLALYGLGFWHQIAWAYFIGIDPTEIRVRLFIEQPRNPEGGGEISLTLAELLEFGEYIGACAAKTHDPNAVRVPGEKQCTFCKRARTRNGCPERNDWLLGMLGLDPDRLDVAVNGRSKFVGPSRLAPARRAYIALHAKELRKWINQVYDGVLDDALKGRPAPGIVPVMGRQPARVWRDAEAAAAVLTKKVGKKQAFKTEVISPTQAEALMSDVDYAKLLAPLVDRGLAGYSIAPANTKRERVTPLDALFDEL